MTLNIQLAFDRVKRDIKNKHFVSPLFLLNILQTDLEVWLSNIKNDIEQNKYHPKSMEVIDIPKGNGLIRPGSFLNIEDNITYTALVQECYGEILERIQWSQNTIDFAYIMTRENINSSEWFKSQLTGWNLFREESLKKIEDSEYVILTDLTGFYENIDIPTLISDLRECNINSNIVNGISKCLNRWAEINNKGIPQSNSASDVLAKLYLDNIDKGLSNASFVHLRYVDDFRIFCKSKAEAKLALIELTGLLRKRGLNLQSSKTKILKSSDAKNEIEGIHPLISDVSEEMKEEIIANFYSEYILDDEETETTNGITPLNVIKRTFQDFFILGNDEKYDKTLFHFLINRLIQEKDIFALDYCLSSLSTHPEETTYILKYSKAIDEVDIILFSTDIKMQEELIKFLKSEEAVYDYQNYQILIWFSENVLKIPDELLKICRTIAFDNNKPSYLRLTAKNLLGKFGNSADLEKIESQIKFASSNYEKAELLCCLSKMEKGKRNSLFGKISNDDKIIGMATSYIKTL